MTLQVGAVYRGTWCGRLAWLYVTHIRLHDIKAGEIHYRWIEMRWPRWLVRFGEQEEDSPEEFVKRLEHASRIINEQASYRSVQAVEVRYNYK